MQKTWLIITLVLLSQILRAQPIINSFNPAAGPVGSTVTISGNNFNTVAANNFVYFGGAKANIISSTSTSILVTVPANAMYLPISVTTNNLTAFSSKPFNVTFTGTGGFSVQSLANKIDSPTHERPSSVVIGDLDGDGKSDIVETNAEYPYSVSVYRNTSADGIISFAPATDLPAGYEPWDVAITDFNGDGKPDLVIANSGFGSTNISILKNTSSPGNISFVAAGTYGTRAYPQSVATGDFDGDGKPDIAVANLGSDMVSVFKNYGTGGAISFYEKVDYEVDSLPILIQIADMDGDGKPDIATSNAGSSNISILKNTSVPGSISFAPRLDISGIKGGFILGDLDGDGKPEITGGSSTATFSVLRNISVPGTIVFDQIKNFTCDNPNYFTISDLDGDGKPDISTSNQIYQGSISINRNISTPGVISFEQTVAVEIAQSANDLASGDLDGDGKPDLVTVSLDANLFSVYRNTVNAPRIKHFTPVQGGDSTIVTITGNGFSNVGYVGFGGSAARSFIVVSDTLITAIVGSGATGNVVVTTPAGTITDATFRYFPRPTITGFTPVTADYNVTVTITGTNFTEATAVKFGGTDAGSFTIVSPTIITAVLGFGSSGVVSVTTPGGTASISGFNYTGTPPAISSFSPHSGPIGTTVTILGSGFSETPGNNTVYFGPAKAAVLSATSTSVQVTVPLGALLQPITVTSNRLTAWSNQNFNVTFTDSGKVFDQNSFSPPVSVNAGGIPQDLDVADIDGDGKADLITSGLGFPEYNRYVLSVMRNTGSPGHIQFAPRVDFMSAAFKQYGDVAGGDINGDGKPDIVVQGVAENEGIYIYINKSSPGNISLAEPIYFFTGNGKVVDISIRDYDGDGKADIAMAVTYWNGVLLMKNTSTRDSISFSDPIPYYAGYSTQSLTVGDLDLDGRADFSVVNYGDPSRNVTVFTNTSKPGTISFSQKDYLAAYPFTPVNCFIGDVNGDDKPELLVSNYDANSISIFRNESTAGNLSIDTHFDIPAAKSEVKLANLDGDGRPDILEIQNPGTMILRNTGTTTNISFDSGVLAGTSVPDITHHFTGDLDGDGKTDLIFIQSNTTMVSILRNQIGYGVPPIINSFIPDTAYAGQTVTISGQRFTGASNISFGGIPAVSFSVINDNKITAVVGNGFSGDVTVLTLAGVGSDSGFVYTGPVIKSFDPIYGSTLTDVTIKGNYFTGAGKVRFGGSPARSFEVVSDSVITAVVGAGATGDVFVESAKGNSSLSGFNYVISPVVTSFSPTSGVSGQTITIYGTNFLTIYSVTFGNTEASSFRIVSDSVITAVVGSGATGAVTVSTAFSFGYLNGFTYELSSTKPLIYSFSPQSSGKGGLISIKGKHFTGSTKLSFGGTDAASFNVVSDSLIQAVVGEGSSGNVFVATVQGRDSLSGFIFVDEPVITPAFKLLEFTGSVVSGEAVIQWKTQNEQKIIGFYLFNSVDSQAFLPIANRGALNGPGVNEYSFKDTTFHGSRKYYRLVTLDSSRQEVYSDIIALGESALVLTNSIKIFPNPATGYVIIEHPVSPVYSTLTIVDMAGRIVRSLKTPENMSRSVMYFDGTLKGMYMLSWTDGIQILSATIYIK